MMIMIAESEQIRLAMRLALAVVIFLPHALIAAVLQGNVVGVSDGDTVKVLDAAKQLHTVRLMGIDAPEKAQPYGQRSKQSLSEMVFQRQVTVEWEKKDKYGRTVGKITSSDGVDVCLEQVNRGMAWHYKEYASEQSLEDRASYSAAELTARSKKVGLWRDQSPIPPWEWRKKSRPMHPGFR